MSLDKSLKRKGILLRRRNVLTRAERIERLTEDERFNSAVDSVFGLPKVKPAAVIVAPTKARKEKVEEGAAEGAEQEAKS